MGVVFLFAAGICIGSFFSMLSYRASIEEEIPFSKRYGLKGRSFCPNCNHTLSSFDLLPLLSFIFLRGKCRYCKEKISWFYPVMEILMGAGFIFAFWRNWGGLSNLGDLGNLSYLFIFIIISILVGVFVADWFFGIIPDIFTFGGIILIGAIRVFGDFGSFGEYLISGVLAYLFFFLLYKITREKGIGFGDVKFAFLMGLLLGPLGTFWALWISFVLGAVFSIFLLLLHRKKFGDTIALGPFLVIGTFLVFFDLI